MSRARAARLRASVWLATGYRRRDCGRVGDHRIVCAESIVRPPYVDINRWVALSPRRCSARGGHAVGCLAAAGGGLRAPLPLRGTLCAMPHVKPPHVSQLPTAPPKDAPTGRRPVSAAPRADRPRVRTPVPITAMRRLDRAPGIPPPPAPRADDPVGFWPAQTGRHTRKLARRQSTHPRSACARMPAMSLRGSASRSCSGLHADQRSAGGRRAGSGTRQTRARDTPCIAAAVRLPPPHQAPRHERHIPWVSAAGALSASPCIRHDVASPRYRVCGGAPRAACTAPGTRISDRAEAHGHRGQ